MLLVSMMLNNNPVINMMGIAMGFLYSILPSFIIGTPIVLKAAAGEHMD